MAREWKGRKEYTTEKSSVPLIGHLLGLTYYETTLYDDEDRSARGVGDTPRESRKRAYKKWREKYE